MSASVLDAKDQKDDLLIPVAEYWMKGRIDAPLRAVERMDENARQMIVLAGALQALLAAVLKLTESLARPGIDGPVFVYAAVVFSLLFLATALAAGVLFVKFPLLRTSEIVPLLESRSRELMLAGLCADIGKFCQQINEVLRQKRIWLLASQAAFALSIPVSIGCLAEMVFGR